MANVIPQQIFIRNGQLHTEFAEDHKVSSAHIRLLLSQNLGKSFTPIGYLKVHDPRCGNETQRTDAFAAMPQT